MRPARPYSRHLSELCEELGGREPDRPAVISGDVTLTYRDLDEEVGRFARALAGLGVRRGGTVGLLCTNRWEWLGVALGSMRLGARVATYNTFAKAWDLEYMLAHSEAEVLVCVERFRSRDYLPTLTELIPELEGESWSSERFPNLREVVVIGEARDLPGARTLDDLLESVGDDLEPVPVSAVDDAFVLYTSGSSARPKAVPLQHYGVIENGFQIGERMELDSSDRVWLAAPLFWAYGAINALPATFTHAAALVLQPAFDPAEALDLIERHRCTVAYTLPNMTSALLGAESFAPERTASLRTGLTLGTEAEIRRTAQALAASRICNIYGGTETYGNCCVTPASWPLERRATSQGPPLPGVSIRIADLETGEPLPTGQIGEIHVRGYLARGYLRDTSGAGAAFGADGWYRTGDLASLDEEGLIHFSARATEMIKTGGINVAPREVEEFIAMHPAVHDVAVVGVPDEVVGEVVVAFVVQRPGHDATESDLRSFCSERVAAYKVPKRIHIVEELPKTDTGKLARRLLIDLAGEVLQETR